jgi:TATA-box binding protein (TBP) (component of TFIID and TFIIIB)
MHTAAIPEPTRYRVSTITCNATISTKVNLDLFFEHIHIEPNGFVWSEFHKRTKGTHPKNKAAKGEDKKPFDNQVTVVYKLGDTYYPNCKMFRNGNIHLTGIRTPEDGVRMMHLLADEVLRIGKTGFPIVERMEDVQARDFQIRMINCDFGFPMKIRRKTLHQVLMNQYDNICSFQPLTYPGVKLQYFWNKTHRTKDGLCHCSLPCFGKGIGEGDGECKKVTVAIFDSGKILITGANSFDQVNDAYRYICKVVQDNVEAVQKVLPGATSLTVR